MKYNETPSAKDVFMGPTIQGLLTMSSTHSIKSKVFFITNGAYNAPFFVTRFREALFHFSAMFDVLETIVPHRDHERMVIEKEIFGREALNVVACQWWL